MNVIETRDLTKFYGKTRGIVDLNLIVKEGDFFGFIGPNGAGKSTTIRTLLGLIRPNSGKAEIFGMDCEKDRLEILSQIGFLPSEVSFYRGMRVREILRLSANLRRQNCDAEAKQLCRRLQLDPDRKVQELSLGNRKKAGIVCALQHRPKLYILDEPTSGLDPLIQREFFSILKERNQEGATILLSSHVLSEVQHNCNRAAVIREGKMIACDDVAVLSRTSTRRVAVRCEAEADLLNLDGIRDVQRIHDQISFLYNGDMNHLMKTLAQLPLADVTIAEPDLEEIFMHYYAEEKPNDGFLHK